MTLVDAILPRQAGQGAHRARHSRDQRGRDQRTVVPARVAALTAREARPCAKGTRRRRRSVTLEVIGIGLWCVLLFEVLIDPARRLEVVAASRALKLIGQDRISGELGDAFMIFPAGSRPMIANLTPSCSTLASVIALSALALTVLRGRRGHTFLAFLAAAVFVISANQLRLVLSLLAGALVGERALLLFHDWVGAVFTFAYTLAGLILMIGLTMMNPERAEQDRTGRHTAGRPAEWARPGLGYRIGRLDRIERPPRRTLTGLVYRYVLPRRIARSLSARRERGRVDYRIGHLAAEARAGALVELAAPGLGVHTATLVTAVAHEADPRVLDPLAHAIAAQQWEPVSDQQIIALRLWARGWLMRSGSPGRPDRPDPADPADPRGPADPPGPAHRLDPADLLSAPAGLRPDPAALPEPFGSPAGAGAGPAGPAHGTGPDPARPVFFPREAFGPAGEPMPRTGPAVGHAVAVTGAGGPAGIAVIRALLAAGHPVLALDADPDAAGLRLATGAAVLPRGDDQCFADAVLRIVAEARPIALISTVVEEYPALDRLGPRLAGLGCRTWLPDSPAAQTCADKVAFSRAMTAAGLPHPPTATSAKAARALPGPWIVKPAHGRGTRHVVRADSRADLERAFKTVPEPLAQSRLSGREFTADVLVARDRTPLVCVPRWRDEVKAGISVRGQTFDSPAVTAIVLRTVHAMGLTGPANAQGFVDDDGTVTMVEVNPRFSGGLPLTLAAGADVVGTYLAGILDPGAELPRLSFRPGIRMSRHFAEEYRDEHGQAVGDPLDRDTRLLGRTAAVLRSGSPVPAEEIEPLLAALAERLGGGPARPPLPVVSAAAVP